MSERMTALDATFLELEEADDSAHMHIGAVMVFDPLPEGRAPSVREVARHLHKRLGAMPRYGQRLSEPRTGGLRWPAWRQQPDFHPRDHVRRAALPAPGGEPELLDWAGDYFSQRLDRSRPLWDLVVVEDLAGGRWALASKTHHCLVDGVGSVDASSLVLDAERVPTRDRHVGSAPTPQAEEPSSGGGLIGSAKSLGFGALAAARTAARLPLSVARAGAGMLAHPEQARETLDRLRGLVEVLMRDEVAAAPRTSLNEPIGARRRLAVMRVQLAELKQIKGHLGGTVNDVVLAIAAAGLRDLLLSRGERLPEQGLRAMVPMNIRDASEHLQLGNKITSLFVHLPVAERDVFSLYRRQVAEAERLKAGRQARGSKTLIDLTAMAPPVIHSFLAQSLFATRLFNVTVTNVPGPQMPLYAFGSRMREVWPLVPIAASHAIGIAVFSYDGQLFFCVNADRESVSDVDVLREGMARAAGELGRAAGVAQPAS